MISLLSPVILVSRSRMLYMIPSSHCSMSKKVCVLKLRGGTHSSYFSKKRGFCILTSTLVICPRWNSFDQQALLANIRTTEKWGERVKKQGFNYFLVGRETKSLGWGNFFRGSNGPGNFLDLIFILFCIIDRKMIDRKSLEITN